jgi:hypothetical protein
MGRNPLDVLTVKVRPGYGTTTTPLYVDVMKTVFVVLSVDVAAKLFVAVVVVVSWG